MNKSWIKLVSILSLTIVVSSCSLLQNKLPDLKPAQMPSKYSMYDEKPDYNTKWWTSLNSPELNSYIQTAITDNFDIRQAWAKLEQSKAQAAKSGSYVYPDVSVNTGVSRSTQKTEGKSAVEADTYSLGLSVNYEIDIWGKIKSNKKSSNLQLQASQEDVSATVMSLSGQIAENWINLISLNEQEKMIKEQLDLNMKLLALIKVRLTQAKSTPLDVYQQEQSIESLKASLIPLNSQRKLYQHQMALLLGKPATQPIRIDQIDFPAIPDVPKAGLPSDLLAMRPDIRAAGLRLKASNWEIAAAKADRLPSLKLTASHTYSSDEVSSIFDNWLTNLAANLTGPIFDAGRRKNEVKRVKSVVDEKLAAYQKVVFTAVKEVEDALVKEKYYRQELKATQAQLALSHKTMDEAKRRYLNGVSDFMTVLKEQVSIASYENSIVKTKANILSSRIQLQKALGGTWMKNIKNPTKNNKKTDK